MASEINEHISAPAPERQPEAPLAPVEGPFSLKTIGKWAVVAVIFALLIYPVIQRLNRPAGAVNSPAAMNLSGADAQVQLSLEFYQAGKYQEAIDAAKVALKLKPDTVIAYNNIAVAYLQLKNYDEALINIREALRIQPDLALAQSNLAWILREQAKAKGGTPAPAPDSAAALIDLSLQKYQEGQFQQCIDAAQSALKLQPNVPEAYNNLSAAYIKLGKWDQAIENAKLALNARPNFELAKNNLNWAILQKSQSSPNTK